jgi:hypothetical protein
MGILPMNDRTCGMAILAMIPHGGTPVSLCWSRAQKAHGTNPVPWLPAFTVWA